MKLNIGAGDIHLEGWTNTDVNDFDITKRWPYKNESADAVNADCVLPHIPFPLSGQPDPLDNVIKECARVLVPCGYFTFSCPDWRNPSEALTDVYHYRIIGPRTFYHYTHENKNLRPLEASGHYFERPTWFVKPVASYEMSLDSESKFLPNFLRFAKYNKGLFTYIFIALRLWPLLNSGRIQWTMKRNTNPFKRFNYE